MSTSFFGREEELARLQRLFELAAERDSKGRSVHGPRMAVIVAHTGVGKTRLAQELYRWLASHPTWDAADFWPDDLGSEKDSLRVNPIVEPCSAKPQFLWWGLRACNHGDRNATAVAAFDEHQIPLRHLTAVLSGGWELGRSALATGVDLLKDAILPTGLAGAWKLGKQAMELRRERQRSSADSEHAARETMADEVVKELQALVASKLPLVLLCDDMQWVDAETLALVDRVWVMAQAQRWPLLIVSTHWETEWNQSCRMTDADRAATFARFSGLAGVEEIKLKCSPGKDLAAWLRQELPGLTPGQLEMLVEKAGSNFLQLVQNVQPLKRKAASFFEDGRLDRPLNRKGESYVGSFETDPDRRARQLFDELSESMQVVLGWGSHIGMRFLREVVVDFAHAMGVALAQEPAASIDEATDPMALLAVSGEHTREFRQGAFHQQAQRVLGLHGYDKATLDGALRQVLIHWIQCSFSKSGELTSPKDGRSVSELPQEEQRDLMVWASDLLPIPECVDWEDEAHVAAVRARVLLENTLDPFAEGNEPFWSRIDALWGVKYIPEHILSDDWKEWLRGGSYMRGAYAAIALWSHGQWGEDMEYYLAIDRDNRLEQAIKGNQLEHACKARDRASALSVIDEYIALGLPGVEDAARKCGHICAHGIFVEPAQLSAVVAMVRNAHAQNLKVFAFLLGQIQCVEGASAADQWLEDMRRIAAVELAVRGIQGLRDVAACFVLAVQFMPKIGCERISARARAAGLTFVESAPVNAIADHGDFAEWFYRLAEINALLGSDAEARRNYALAVDWGRREFAKHTGESGPYSMYRCNDIVWSACCCVRIDIASERYIAAREVLAAVDSEVAILTQPAVRNHHFLDSAATVFELRSQIATAIGDAEGAKAAGEMAFQVRIRIAGLSAPGKS